MGESAMLSGDNIANWMLAQTQGVEWVLRWAQLGGTKATLAPENKRINAKFIR